MKFEKQEVPKISKSLSFKVVELINALQLLRDAIAAVREGKSYHIVTLSGQLRGLLVDKPRRSESRLLQVASDFGMDLTVYHTLGVDDPSRPVDEGLILHVVPLAITRQRTRGNQNRGNLADCLKLKIMHYKGTDYELREIVEWYANLLGGAHYSKHLPEDLAELLSSSPIQNNALDQLLVNFAEVVLECGTHLLKVTSNFECHLSIATPSTPKTSAVILDALHPGTPMRFSLFLAKTGKPLLRLIGVDGNETLLDCKPLIRWHKLHYISVSTEISDRLFTDIQIKFDGEVVAKKRHKKPIYIYHNWIDFDVYFNRLVDGGEQDFSFALGEYKQWGKRLSSIQRAEHLVRFSKKFEDDNLKVVLYTSNSFGRSGPGSRNLSMTGKVTHCAISSLFDETENTSSRQENS